MLNTPPNILPCLHSVDGSRYTSVRTVTVLPFFHCSRHLDVVVVVVVVTTKFNCLRLLSLGGRFATFRRV